MMKTNLQHKQHKTFSGRNAILLAITALALCASPDNRADADCFCATYWTGAIDNNWFNPGNWTGVVPDCGQNCGLPVGPYINSGMAQISTQAQTASACEMFLGHDSGNSGSLSVNHGTLNQCGDIFVGWQGKGSLSITNGGFVHTFFNPSIASETGSSGSVTVDGQYQDGTKSQWTVAGELDVGGTINAAGGTGLSTVTNGGIVTAGDKVYVWKSGTLTGNSTVSTTNGTNVEGTVSPNWTLTIDGDLTFVANTAATMQCNVTPANLSSPTADAEVTGRATLNDKLSVTMTGTFTCGTTFTLLHSQGVLSNQFSSYSITFPTGQGWSPEVTYDYNTNKVKLYLACNTN